MNFEANNILHRKSDVSPSGHRPTLPEKKRKRRNVYFEISVLYGTIGTGKHKKPSSYRLCANIPIVIIILSKMIDNIICLSFMKMVCRTLVMRIHSNQRV